MQQQAVRLIGDADQLQAYRAFVLLQMSACITNQFGDRASSLIRL